MLKKRPIVFNDKPSIGVEVLAYGSNCICALDANASPDSNLNYSEDGYLRLCSCVAATCGPFPFNVSVVDCWCGVNAKARQS